MHTNKNFIRVFGVLALLGCGSLLGISLGAALDIPFLWSTQLVRGLAELAPTYPMWLVRGQVTFVGFMLPMPLMLAHALLKALLLPRDVPVSAAFAMEWARAEGLGWSSVSFWFGAAGNFRASIAH